MTKDISAFEWFFGDFFILEIRIHRRGAPESKKGSDKGIDGVINFIEDEKKLPQKVLVQVKSGKVNSGLIRDFRGTLERENAAMGIFVTLDRPT